MKAVVAVLMSGAFAFAIIGNLMGSTGALTWGVVFAVLASALARYRPLSASESGVVE